MMTSAQKMETTGFSKNLAYINQSTWWFNPKEHQRKHIDQKLFLQLLGLILIFILAAP
jgi:hypothetical protein